MSYHGIYQSSTTSITGCPKQFTTLPRDEIRFPPQVQYHCDSCGKVHGFRFMRTFSVTTPKQQKRFVEMCENNGIEQNVEVP